MNFLNNLRERYIYQLFYRVIRIGMGLTFISSGIRKMPGVRFTALPIDNPVGAYFNAMHETGFYWNFIGYFQIVIGILVFFNRTVVVSSTLMMPVSINIFLISISLHMTGTPVITTLMLLGNLFLLFWHYENYLSVIQKPGKLTKLRASKS